MQVSLHPKNCYLGFDRDLTHEARIRHVKCDEQEPTCFQCLKSGRQCEGYSIYTRRPERNSIKIVHWQLSTLALSRVSVDVTGNEKERRAFEFFRKVSVPEFSGFLESNFWSRLVLQASHTESTIRHAVIALGALHESRKGKDPMQSPKSKAYNPFALQQCNKAIGHLNQKFSGTRQQSIAVLLLSCVLFVCFESLQCNYEMALSHMQSGLSVFRSWQAEARKSGGCGAIASSNTSDWMHSEILSMFSRLNLQALLFIETHILPMDFLRQDASALIESVPSTFTSLNEARNWLDDSVSYIFQTATAAHLRGDASGDKVSTRYLPGRASDDLLVQWSTAFDAFIQSVEKALEPKDIQGVTVLEIQYKVAKVVVAVGIPPNELAFDGFEAEFGSIVFLVSSLIRSPNTSEISELTKQFCFEMNLIPALYFVATKCREPSIRRQALSILSEVFGHECLWNSKLMSKIAERVILIEEEKENIGQVTSADEISATTRVSVLSATIYSKRRQVLVKCCQEMRGGDKRMRHEWITY